MKPEIKVIKADDEKSKSIHNGSGYSKLFANPDICGAKNFSFLINKMKASMNCNLTGLGHKHDEEHCMYTLSGKGGISIDGVKHSLEPHMFIFIPPGVMHYVWADTDSDLEYIVIYSPSGPEKNL